MTARIPLWVAISLVTFCFAVSALFQANSADNARDDFQEALYGLCEELNRHTAESRQNIDEAQALQSDLAALAFNMDQEGISADVRSIRFVAEDSPRCGSVLRPVGR